MEADLKQAMATRDSLLIGSLYSNLADSLIGLAGAARFTDDPTHSSHQPSSSPSKLSSTTRFLAKADDALQRAAASFGHALDTRRQCTTLAKISLIAKMRGDHNLADSWSQKYFAVLSEAQKDNTLAADI